MLQSAHNPCIITLNHKECLSELAREASYAEQDGVIGRSGLYDDRAPQYENAKLFYSRYEAIVELLKANKLGRYAKYLTYSLCPKFSDDPPGLSDSKIGGIPDLRNELHFMSALRRMRSANGISNEADGLDMSIIVRKAWPVCGACQEPMQFLAQIDMQNWLLPIWLATNYQQGGEYPYICSGLGLDRVVNPGFHIYKRQLWSFFVCAYASEHFCNPNYDAHLKFCRTYKEDKRECSEERFLSIFADAGFSEQNACDAPMRGKKIIGLELQFDLDYHTYLPNKVSDRLHKLIDAHPELFGSYADEYAMFGEPRSQQMPKRYWAQSGSPRRLTPVINYNHSERDMTYQLYYDLVHTDHGFEAFGKVDASCT